VYRTDQDGAITSIGDGTEMKVTTFLHAPTQALVPSGVAASAAPAH
jgi:hypothetical protein